jgi:hypothetical protein
MKKYLIFTILLCFTWAGMLLGISFLEAPVKFTAPSLTLAIGLDVGRHVFQAFNKIEMVFALLLIAIILFTRPPLIIKTFFFSIIALLLLECLWLLPVLDERALQVIAGEQPQKESPHVWYIVFDALKVFLLFASGLFCFKETKEAM